MRRRRIRGRILMVLALGIAATSIRGADEVERLCAQLEVPARFAAHVPSFSLAPFERTFAFSDGPHTWRFMGIKDGARFVAYVPLEGAHNGIISLLTHDPALAPLAIPFPSERFHIDTAPGAGLRTDHFLAGKGWQEETRDGESSRWELAADARSVTLHRRFAGALTRSTWGHDLKAGPLQVDHHGVFRIGCDPVHGYVVDARWTTGVSDPKRLGQYVSLVQASLSNPWVRAGTPDLFVTCPRGGSGYLAHAHNHAAIGRIGGCPEWTLRDGGFVAFLDPGGWSLAQVLRGADAKLGVCNVHADQDLIPHWPQDGIERRDGLQYHTVEVRQVFLPPEVTAHVRSSCRRLFTDQRAVILPLGDVVDFEDQPLSAGTHRIGLTWTTQPEISTAAAHSGERSLRFRGLSWPNLPQIALKPGRAYRLDAWFKVEAATAADIDKLHADHERAQADQLERWRKDAAKAKAAGMEAPPEPVAEPWREPGPAAAWCEGHLYKWSPHVSADRVLAQATGKVVAGSGWQRVELEFASPDWGPFIDIRFVCSGGGTAYLDDFSFRERP